MIDIVFDLSLLYLSGFKKFLIFITNYISTVRILFSFILLSWIGVIWREVLVTTLFFAILA